MRRTMELIALFDNDAFATKRVRLFEVENGRPSDMAKELETVFKAFALSEKNSRGEVHADRPHQYDHRGGAESRRHSTKWRSGSPSSTFRRK